MSSSNAESVVRKRPVATTKGLNPVFEINTVEVGNQVLRVGIRRGAPGATPLLLFNGIGANLELLEPFVAMLPGVEVIAFDVPGIGGSPTPRFPYRLRHLAKLADHLLTQLGYADPVDVLGISWGGAAAQQFARNYRHRCRRLVLAATSAGVAMVPGKLSVISKLVNPRRYYDGQYMERIGAQIYGGAFRNSEHLLRRHARHVKPPRGRGYLYQLLAGMGWTSIWWLPLLRQPTLVLAGSDDPIIPLINGRILAALIPDSQLHIFDDGHLFLISRAAEVAPIVRSFLCAKEAAGEGTKVRAQAI